MEIEYLSTNSGVQEVLIMGEFNKWCLDFMKQDETFSIESAGFNRFAHRCKVPIGYKYRYQLMVDGNFVIDENALKSFNLQGQETNYKLAAKNDESLNHIIS